MSLINLVLTTDKLQLITSAAVTVDVHASFMDLNAGTVTPGKQNTAITTATTTDIVAAPASSTVRNVKLLLIRNKHATTPVDVTVVFDANGTDYELHKVTLRAGETLEFSEGVGFFTLTIAANPLLMRALDADGTGANVNTAQPWFPSLGAVTLVASTTYFVSGVLALVRAAGTTSHTTGILWGGTATLTNMFHHTECNVGEVDTLLPVSRAVGHVATLINVKAASVSATEAISMLVHGIVRCNAAGTFIPQFQYSVAPGGAPTIRRNSFIRLEPVGSNTFTTLGPWS